MSPAYILASSGTLDPVTGEPVLDDKLMFLVKPISAGEVILLFTDLPSAQDYLARCDPLERQGNPGPLELATDRVVAKFLHWARSQLQIEWVTLDLRPPSNLVRPLPIDKILAAYLGQQDTQGQE